MISYGLTAELLAEVLPTGGDINVAGVYRNLQGVAERMEAELGEEKWHFIDGCQREWDMLPPPRPPCPRGAARRPISRGCAADGPGHDKLSGRIGANRRAYCRDATRAADQWRREYDVQDWRDLLRAPFHADLLHLHPQGR